MARMTSPISRSSRSMVSPFSFVMAVSMPPVGPLPSVFVRPATEHDVTFLTDVVVVATRAQGRLPDDFDEEAYRAGFAEWLRSGDPLY